MIRRALLLLVLACGSKSPLEVGGPSRRARLDAAGLDAARVRDSGTDSRVPRDTLPPLPDSDFRIDAGDSGCRPQTENVDLLLMVDGSGSMRDEQMVLAQELPRLVGALLSGDVDFGTPMEGTADFPPVRSLNVGLVSADLATGVRGGFCTRPHGQDAVIGGGAPLFLNFESPAAARDFDRQFIDLAARMGSCPIEQSAEAVLKSLVPSDCREGFCEFMDGSRGQGDGPNAGFLRDDSLLAVVVLTDEDDCSAENPSLFAAIDPERPTEFTRVTLNLRCTTFPEALTPVARYTEGLSFLRPDPRQLVYALVAGFPPGFGSLDGVVDYNAVLASPDMEIRPDDFSTSRVAPACEGEGGPATPARRLLGIAQGLEARGTPTVAQSICESRYDGLINGLTLRIAERALETCEL
ncbi:MAG: hypothetical protein AAGE52_09875 [Myxococcota bacterium]